MKAADIAAEQQDPSIAPDPKPDPPANNVPEVLDNEDTASSAVTSIYNL